MTVKNVWARYSEFLHCYRYLLPAWVYLDYPYILLTGEKEIGVRKVLGASVQHVIGLLSKDFIRLVFLAAVVAFPIAWWAMNKWLQDFSYRINIEWWVFILAMILALFIALFTISSQAIKAAIANPVNSLRSE